MVTRKYFLGVWFNKMQPLFSVLLCLIMKNNIQLGIVQKLLEGIGKAAKYLIITVVLDEVRGV